MKGSRLKENGADVNSVEENRKGGLVKSRNLE
jgi:hypothetical protein